MMTDSRLVLGTAQLGMHYGIANKSGQPDRKLALNIVDTAWKNGIRQFDTAQAYGQSEDILGYCLSELNVSKEARVISKFDPALDHLSWSELSQSLDRSLYKIGLNNLHAMMLHNEDLLSLWSMGLSDIILDLKNSGRICHAGVSVYNPKKALQALATEGLDFVQLPTNILDRRFESAGVFELASKLEKRIYIRSVYLQGLLIMDVNHIPPKMSFATPILRELDLLCEEYNLNRKEIALRYIKNNFPHAHVLFGAETPDQVLENVALWDNKQSRISFKIPPALMNIDEAILNPCTWPILK